MSCHCLLETRHSHLTHAEGTMESFVLLKGLQYKNTTFEKNLKKNCELLYLEKKQTLTKVTVRGPCCVKENQEMQINDAKKHH